MDLGSLMRTRRLLGASLLVLAGFAFSIAAACAAEIKVMSSGGFKAAYLELAAEFERTPGTNFDAWGPSLGNTPQAVPIASPVASRSTS